LVQHRFDARPRACLGSREGTIRRRRAGGGTYITQATRRLRTGAGRKRLTRPPEGFLTIGRRRDMGLRRQMLLAAFALALAPSARAEDLPGAERFRERVQPILARYCYACHGDGAEEGGVRLDGYASDAELMAARDRWGAALKNVR